ncbi:MAG: 3-phosphoshikimate 1-carboxyvinyltransferase [Lachnospiraceae bacterium]|nr:3-phosphoshikimate 1-carboxyvinyltransferase [Lachnospiraceae bacterium]
MDKIIKRKEKGLKGTIRVPGDKSISHRSVMLNAISEGTAHITGFLNGADCISTINCFRAMGVDIEYDGGNEVTVHGVGLNGLKKPASILDCGNSGTTTRIISGLLSGQNFPSSLTGDASICKRPMKRVIEPLTLMGANIRSVHDNGCAPLEIKPSSLKGIEYISPVASAQVKSCILLAGLYADSPTTVSESALSRNHTELMLGALGADISTKAESTDEGRCFSVTITPGKTLKASDVTVPGDISSAAYFIGAALIVPGSDIMIDNVGINPTRAGIIKVLKEMGGNITLMNERTVAGEAVADIHVTSSSLRGTEIAGEVIPTLIDELPLIAVVASCAEGTTLIKDASELKVKESDRITLVTENLKAMGADIEATDDGFIINKNNDPLPLHGTVINDALDHRIAMSFAIAGLIASGETRIVHPECVSISYPDFFKTTDSL